MEEKETIQPIEITWEELQSRDLDRYILVDTRGDEAVNYGMIPGAIAIPECELIDRLAAAAGDKKVILYCSRGQNSKVSAEYFREQGMEAYSLQGGYTGWLLNLKGLTSWEKAEALISVAHPDFREELIREAEKLHIWRRSNKI